MIPRIAHFVFGLDEQREPFHFLHYVSLESCRRVLEPEVIYFHHKHLPWGPWWERIAPYLTLREADHVEEVLAARYRSDRVPGRYRYAHHADFIRLDALIEHGGVYADIDTIFVRPFPDELFAAPFVIGREPPVLDEHTREPRPSLCNALLMSEPGAEFPRSWRAEMAEALDGTWSNHSGFLAEQLSRVAPGQARIEPEASFFPFASTRAGLRQLLHERRAPPGEALSVHLWAHLWWERERRDFSLAHAGWAQPALLRGARSTLADLARPYLPDRARRRRRAALRAPERAPWSYLSLDENGGYGVAGLRCMTALEQCGIELEWTPFVTGRGWRLAYEPAPGHFEPVGGEDRHADPAVIVAHLVPEYYPLVRGRAPDAFLIGYTAWETDRIPSHWVPCLEQADCIVVPSRFSAEVIAASQLATPVEVVPHATMPCESGAIPGWPERSDDVFVFYTIGDWTERKALHMTIEAYLRAFRASDRVVLVAKTSPRDWRHPEHPTSHAGEGTTPWSLAQMLARHPNPPAVRLITRELTDAEIAALHDRGDCYVSLCRGEGFGLGAFDAATQGKPVVMTGFGGQLEFLAGSPYLVDFELVPVSYHPSFASYTPDQRWAEADLDHAAALLREIASGRELAAERARSMARDIRARFGPAQITQAFVSVVERHYRQPTPGGQSQSAIATGL
jgi:glycosyltransferase involved in cell wall biosynthesis